METEEILAAIQKAADTIATPNCAAWLSAIAALAAVAVAIIIAIKQNRIAKKQNEIARKQAEISEQQNRIALFEKRYDIYYEITKIIEIGEQLASPEPLSIYFILCLLEVDLEIKFSDEQDKNAMLTMVYAKLSQAMHIVDQAVFLFPRVDETDIEQLFGDALDFITFLATSNEEEINKENADVRNFINTSKDFKGKYFEMIENKLDLTGGV